MKTHDKKYYDLRDRGWDALGVFLKILKDGGSDIDAICIVRATFNLSLVEAKEIMLKAQGWPGTLEDYQKNILFPAIEQALAEKKSEP